MYGNEISEKVQAYMLDEDMPAYALVLYGEWGSGKTYYCEHDLKTALKKNGRRVCRISLFGVKDSEELYSRILSSYFLLNKECDPEKGAKTAAKALAQVLTKQAGSFVGSQLSKYGIQVSFKPQVVIGLLDMNRVLIILDDTERSSFAKDDQLFFGVVNEMVENRGWHVLVVRNAPVLFESKPAEKSIFSQMEYEPDSVGLYEAIVEPRLNGTPGFDFDVKRAIIRGIEGSRHNARALLRVIPTISAALNSDVMSDVTIAAEGRSRALTDFVRYAIQSASGDAPKKPDKNDSSSSVMDPFVSLDYERYKSLAGALDVLSLGQDADSENVARCFESYVAKRYPDSPEDIEMKHLYDRWVCLKDMTDAEVDALASELAVLLARAGYSHLGFYRLCSMVMTLVDLGFKERLSRCTLLESLKKAGMRDLSRCLRYLEQERQMSSGLYSAAVCDVMDELIEYLRTEEAEADRSRFEALVSSLEDEGQAVARLASFLEEGVVTGSTNRLLAVPPEYVARAFCSGTPASQLALHNVFSTTIKTNLEPRSSPEVLSWLCEVESCLASASPRSRMDSLRLEWLQSDLKEIAKNEMNHD